MPNAPSRLLLGGIRGNALGVDLGLLLLRTSVGLPLCTIFEKFLPRNGIWGPQTWFVSEIAAMGLPSPLALAWCAVCAEFFGGILLILGGFTRLAALANAITTFFAAFLYHKDVTGDGLLAFSYFCATSAIVLTGPGRFSLDALLARSILLPQAPPTLPQRVDTEGS